MATIEVYDTTLRDGTQAEDIAFTLEDKMRIAHFLDEMGFHYIEVSGFQSQGRALFRGSQEITAQKRQAHGFRHDPQGRRPG